MGAKNRGGIGLSYRPARLHRLAELIPFRFLGSLKVKKFGLWSLEKKKHGQPNTIQHFNFLHTSHSLESIPGPHKHLKIRAWIVKCECEMTTSPFILLLVNYLKAQEGGEDVAMPTLWNPLSSLR